MALSYLRFHPPPLLTPSSSSSESPILLRSLSRDFSFLFASNPTAPYTIPNGLSSASPEKWRAKVSFFPAFLKKGKDAQALKEELLDAIAPLDRGAEASPEDQERVDQVWIYLSRIASLKPFPLSFYFSLIRSLASSKQQTRQRNRSNLLC